MDSYDPVQSVLWAVGCSVGVICVGLQNGHKAKLGKIVCWLES